METEFLTIENLTMPDLAQPPSITSYAPEVSAFRKPAIIIPVKTRLRPVPAKKEEPPAPPDQSFEEWNLPPQENGYIKCGRHDFL